MTTIQVRMDERIKRESNKILEELGMDMSGAIKIYLKQIVTHKGIPFHLITENGMTPQEEKKILVASQEAQRGKNVKKFKNAKDAIRYLQRLA